MEMTRARSEKPRAVGEVQRNGGRERFRFPEDSGRMQEEGETRPRARFSSPVRERSLDRSQPEKERDLSL